MAKVTGALFSLEASGGFGSAIVYSKWKGRPTARRLTPPSQPHSAGQETARNRVRVSAAGVNWANNTSLILSGETETDKARIIAVTPAGYAWNGHLVDVMIGKGAIDYDAASTAWGALSAGEKTAWDTAAGALTPVISETYQTQSGGTAGTNATPGETWFHYQYALSLLGLNPTPGAVPPTYA